MKIAFFDSGIGGLTVLREALKLLPNEHYIYYADTRNVPYGTKSRDEVKSYVLEAGAFLAGLGIDMLVIACNTATSVAVADLRYMYGFPVIGMEPAVKPAVEKEAEKRILVLATTLTLREEKLNTLISRLDGRSRLDKLSLDGLVGYAEEFRFEGAEVENYLHGKFSGINKKDYGCVVLGCTHFLYYRDMIKSYFNPESKIIDGNIGTVRNMKSIIDKKNMVHESGTGSMEFYNSGVQEIDPARLKMIRDIVRKA